MKQQSWWPSTDDDTNPYEKKFKDQMKECKANGTLFEAKIPTSGKIALACAKYKCHCNSKVCSVDKKDDSHTASIWPNLTPTKYNGPNRILRTLTTTGK